MFSNTYEPKPQKIPLKLFIGFIFTSETIYLQTKHILERKFGRADFESQTIAFNHTAYYENEFGTGLKRKFLSFKRLINPERQFRIKITTNKIEQRLSISGKRQINIDPGILTLAKVILFTTKDYNHRIYLAQGIYAEVTLSYQSRSFQPWEWTYPDYKTPEYIQTFNHIRKIFSAQIQ
ncbi:MAG: DUF4416 family protein [Candidatus Omnitrophota bacterium]